MLKFDEVNGLGFFAMACSPGGAASNLYTYLLAGDVSLSVTMTLCSTILSLGKFPCRNGKAELHSSVVGGGWFDPCLCQYSFQGLMIVIATGFIPLSLLFVVLTMVMWESS